VLKVRHLSGVPTLSLRHADLGSFALPQDWTDWSAPAEPIDTTLMIDAFGLAALATMVDFLMRHTQGD